MGSIAADYIKVLTVGASGAALFPAAAAMADDLSNPTTTVVGSLIHGYDASNNQWERCRVNADRNLIVSIGSTATPGDTVGNSGFVGCHNNNGAQNGQIVANMQYSDVTTQWSRGRSFAGAHANIWTAASAVAGTPSTNKFDASFFRTVSAFGSTSIGTVVRPVFSQDDTNYYTAFDIEFTSTAQGANFFFGGTFDVGARYVKLVTQDNCTITATIAGKGI